MTTVDLNCDLGEGAGHDAELIPLVSSANVACGGHAGDRASMLAAIDLALASRVAVGAHPGYEDREGFGRREMGLSDTQVLNLVAAQVDDLCQLALSRGAQIRHVKPHGALYNRAARDRPAARAIARAVAKIDRRLILFGLAGSDLLDAGRAEGLRVASEVFADRGYEPDGSLTPRSSPGALIEGEDRVAARVIGMVRDGRVRASNGADLRVHAETVCLHGDGPAAVALARSLRRAFAAAGIVLRRPLATGEG